MPVCLRNVAGLLYLSCYNKYGVIIMTGGSAMLIATIMSAFATTPAVEAQMLMPEKSSNCCNENAINHEAIIKALIERQSQISSLLTDFRTHYHLICEASSLIEPSAYENLRCLDLVSRGISEYLKDILARSGDSIKTLHGVDVYNQFRNVVASHGQLRKNISNIYAAYNEHLGLNEIVEVTHFTPSKDFILAAFQASESVYGTH
jgi:hypothetical protein